MVGWLVGSGKDCRQLQEQVMLLPSAWFAMAINGRIELLALQLNASLVLGVHSQEPKEISIDPSGQIISFCQVCQERVAKCDSKTNLCWSLAAQQLNNSRDDEARNLIQSCGKTFPSRGRSSRPGFRL